MTEHPADLPMGLVVTDDGSILNWQGVNYVRQDAAERYAKSDLANAHPPVTAEPATAPSVEQICEVLGNTQRVLAHEIAAEIHALYGTPGDAGEHGSDVVDRTEHERMAQRAKKAEARAEGLASQMRTHALANGGCVAADAYNELAENYHAEVERCKAALEASGEALRAEQENHRATIGLYETGRARREAGEQHRMAAAKAMAAADTFAAARAAVEAETSEEAGDE